MASSAPGRYEAKERGCTRNAPVHVPVGDAERWIPERPCAKRFRFEGDAALDEGGARGEGELLLVVAEPGWRGRAEIEARIIGVRPRGFQY